MTWPLNTESVKTDRERMKLIANARVGQTLVLMHTQTGQMVPVLVTAELQRAARAELARRRKRTLNEVMNDTEARHDLNPFAPNLPGRGLYSPALKILGTDPGAGVMPPIGLPPRRR